MDSKIKYLSQRQLDEAIHNLINEVNEGTGGSVEYSSSSGEYLFAIFCLILWNGFMMF